MPYTQEQINKMTPEQKQALLQQVDEELARRQGGESQEPQSTGGRILKGVGRGIMAGVKALPSILGVETGEETGDLETFRAKERIKKQVGEEFPKEPTEFERGSFELREEREQRIANEQKIRQQRFRIDNLFNIGGEVGSDEIKGMEQTLTQSLEPQLEAGRGEPTIDKETGDRKYRVLSNAEWNKRVSQGTFSPSEIEHLQNTRAENRAWTNVLERLTELGITVESAGELEFDMINSPIGPISLPARFNLVGQFKRDPKYTSIKRDIELAFQAFRKRVTGAQASDRELKMLRPLLADLRDRPEVFFQTIQNSIENTEIAFNDRLDLYKRAGRDTTQFDGLLKTVSPGRRIETSPEEEEEEVETIYVD